MKQLVLVELKAKMNSYLVDDITEHKKGCKGV